jgi:hypothetical protein
MSSSFSLVLRLVARRRGGLSLYEYTGNLLDSYGNVYTRSSYIILYS